MKGNKTKKVLLLVGLICLVPVVIVGLYMSVDLYHFFNPYLDREISGPMTISSQWIEIVPKKPLSVQRQIQYMILDVIDPFDPDYDQWSLRLQDGSIVTPEVQLVDESGNTYNLTSPALDSKGIGFRNSELPKDRAYRAVRIRSNKPIKLSRIYWRCYNQWDVS
jgi:hypothetical protein